MKLDFKLKRKLLQKYKSSYLKLKRIERWYQYLEPEVEFFLYEDFIVGKPDYIYYRLDVLNDERQVFTKNDKSFKQLVDYLAAKTKRVREIYYGNN